MKNIFTLLAAVFCFATAHAQFLCSATIGGQANPNTPSVSLWVENYTGDSANTSVVWVFCDGTAATGWYANAPLGSGGAIVPNCVVCVTLEDSISGCRVTACDTFNPSGNPSNNNCAAYASFTNVDTLYTFFANHTGGLPVIYEWKVNGVVIDTTPQLTLVVDAANYPNGASVCLGIVDAAGCASTDCVNVGSGNVFGGGGVPCQAYFVIVPDTGANSSGTPGNYVGYNLSSGNYGNSILWDFGDGTTSTDPYPSHTYANPGNYIVCLTVGVPAGNCYDTYCDSSFYAFKTDENPMHQLNILGPTGIAKTEVPDIRIFPNPVTNELRITGWDKPLTVRVYNAQGQLVFQNTGRSGAINTSGFSTGSYILEINTGKPNVLIRKRFQKN